MFQQNCRQSFIIPSSILDTDPMSKKDCDIKADKYLQVPKINHRRISSAIFATMLAETFTLLTKRKQSTINVQSLIVNKLRWSIWSYWISKFGVTILFHLKDNRITWHIRCKMQPKPVYLSYSWWKPTNSVKSRESWTWACNTFHWDSITSTWGETVSGQWAEKLSKGKGKR